MTILGHLGRTPAIGAGRGVEQARMLFVPRCAVTLQMDRLTPLWGENV